MGLEPGLKESRVVADTTSWGRLFHSSIVRGKKLHLPVLRMVVGKVILDVMGMTMF